MAALSADCRVKLAIHKPFSFCSNHWLNKENEVRANGGTLLAEPFDNTAYPQPGVQGFNTREFLQNSLSEGTLPLLELPNLGRHNVICMVSQSLDMVHTSLHFNLQVSKL